MAIVLVGVGFAVDYFVRKELKSGDVLIDKERERERVMEEQQTEAGAARFQHFSHSHPLSERFCSAAGTCRCGVCQKSVSGWAYHCKPCNFFLHKVCATMPVTLSPCMYSLAHESSSHVPKPTITNSFAHQQHPVKEIYSNADYKCPHCHTSGCGKRFRCETCRVDLHPVCVTHPTRMLSFLHPEHELELRTKPHFKGCAICGHHLGPNIRAYGCKTCEFYVHPTCSQMPQYLLHENHPVPHPLRLKQATCSRMCDTRCKKACERGRWCYECKICGVSFHVACLLKRSLKGTSKKVKTHEIVQLLIITENIALLCQGGLGPFDVAGAVLQIADVCCNK